jgi:hypothetical protein
LGGGHGSFPLSHHQVGRVELLHQRLGVGVALLLPSAEAPAERERERERVSEGTCGLTGALVEKETARGDTQRERGRVNGGTWWVIRT